jgi:Tfp pilus assembly protein PilF
MKSKLKFMFGLICVGVFFALPVSAQGIGDRNRPSGEGTYRIMGKVMLPNGTPAVDVSVTASGAEFSNGSARTDRDGAFVISGLSGGNYNVVVRQKGYQTETESLTILKETTAGQSFQLVFHLRPVGEARSNSGASSAGTTEVPPEAAAKFNEAIEYLKKDDAKKALPLLEEAIKAHPKYAAAYYEKGAAYLKLTDPDKATEAFVQAITLKPDYFEAKYGYGVAQYQKKNYGVAEAAFRDVLKQKNDMAEAYMYLGISLFYLKNPNEAQMALQNAIKSKGGDKLSAPHLYMGLILMDKKENNKAVSELEKFLEMNPTAPNADKIKTTIANLKKQS